MAPPSRSSTPTSAPPGATPTAATRPSAPAGGGGGVSWLAMVTALAAVAGWLAMNNVHYAWTPLLAAVETRPFTQDEAARDRVVRDRVPVKLEAVLTGAPALHPDGFRDPESRLSRVILRNVQATATGGPFSAYDAGAVLAGAGYLDVAPKFPASDVVTARDFWVLAEASAANNAAHGTTGLLRDGLRRLASALGAGTGEAEAPALYYEDDATRAFGEVAQDIPGVLVHRGDVKPWIVMATAGAVRRGQLNGGLTYLTQLYGNSTVTLYAPTELPSVHLYPSYHPNARQTQAGIGVPFWAWRTPTAWPHLLDMAHREPVHAFQTTLRASEVLFIPPFWLYQVTHDSDSIQLRAETESMETTVRSDLLGGMALPASDAVAYQALILRRVIVNLVSHVVGANGAASAAENETAVAAWLDEHLIRARYAPLYGRLELRTDTDYGLCGRDRAGQLSAVVLAEVADVTLPLVAAVRGRLDYIVATMGSPAGPAVRNHVLADYIERIVHFGVSAEDAYAFFASCFAAGLRNVVAVPAAAATAA